MLCVHLRTGLQALCGCNKSCHFTVYSPFTLLFHHQYFSENNHLLYLLRFSCKKLYTHCIPVSKFAVIVVMINYTNKLTGKQIFYCYRQGRHTRRGWSSSSKGYCSPVIPHLVLCAPSQPLPLLLDLIKASFLSVACTDCAVYYPSSLSFPLVR